MFRFDRYLNSAATICALLLAASTAVLAQGPQPIRSPDVLSDRRVTFRFRAPNAKEVFVAREGAQRLAMAKDDKGVWSVTTDPLEPDLYGYSIIADGVGLIDPLNPEMKPNILNTQSLVHVPGPSSIPWEVNNVPHGTVHHHFYRSQVVGDDRDFYVYTPPGYDVKARKPYPTLYLLHGFSDNAGGWTDVGRAHVILDNLIAQGKAKPMLIVMPLGYGAPEILGRSGSGPRDPNLGKRNFDKFAEALITEVIPAVEKAYHVDANSHSRAICGLSMGGGESITTGLNHLDTFSWVGSFSGAVIMAGNDLNQTLPPLDSSANAKLKLLWIGCGKDDFLINSNHQLDEWLKAKGITHTFVETPGAHTWLVWRRYLADFAPLLFR